MLGQRYYDPLQGRFLTRDPLGYDGGMNLYAYCGDDPINFLDPMGLYYGQSNWWANQISGWGETDGVDWFGNATNFAAGMGSKLTGGLTDKVDNALGDAGMVNLCSGSYQIDGDAGNGLNLALASVGDEQGLAAEGADMAAEGADGAAEGIEEEAGGCSLLCLAPGTPVWMADGTEKPIQDIHVGDKVLSRDPVTGQNAVKTVTATIQRPAALVTLTVADTKTGQTAKLTCTPNHPLYMTGKGWVEAGDLGIGTSIVTRAGPPVVVKAVVWQRDETGSKPFTVYNLTIANDHTYFAGSIDGGLWAHNDCTEDAKAALKALDGDGEIVHVVPMSGNGGVAFGDPESSISYPYHDIVRTSEGDIIDSMTTGHTNPVPFTEWLQQFSDKLTYNNPGDYDIRLGSGNGLY